MDIHYHKSVPCNGILMIEPSVASPEIGRWKANCFAGLAQPLVQVRFAHVFLSFLWYTRKGKRLDWRDHLFNSPPGQLWVIGSEGEWDASTFPAPHLGSQHDGQVRSSPHSACAAQVTLSWTDLRNISFADVQTTSATIAAIAISCVPIPPPHHPPSLHWERSDGGTVNR